MFTKGNKVYSDTYKYLKHNEKNIIALSYVGNADDFHEEDMTLPIEVQISDNMIFWENKKLATLPKKLDYASIKEHLIKSRYTYDEQLAIMLNKDKTSDGKLQYSRMQAWRDFAGEIARIVDEEGHEAITALTVAKEKKMAEIAAYDSSSAVNSFTINDIEVWLDKETRAGLKLRFEAEMVMGKTETTLWYEGIQFKLTLEQAIQMLYAIEVYASTCYDNTQRHYSLISISEDLDYVINYDYTTGYPEKLKF